MSRVEARSPYLSRARDVASQYFTGVPPCKLESLYPYFGVLEVRERQLDRDAQIIPAGSGFIIEINALVSGARRRLSIAHELAHLILLDVDKDVRSGPAVEQLCNELAGELLVPSTMLHATLAEQRTIEGWRDCVTCSSIFNISRRFAVSVEVAARRVFRDLDLVANSAAIIWRQFPEPGGSLRVGSAWSSPQWEAFIPRRKRVPKDSVILKAFHTEGTFVAHENLRLGSLRGVFDVQASGYMSFPLRAATPPDRSVLSLVSKAIETTEQPVAPLQQAFTYSEA